MMNLHPRIRLKELRIVLSPAGAGIGFERSLSAIKNSRRFSLGTTLNLCLTLKGIHTPSFLPEFSLCHYRFAFSQLLLCRGVARPLPQETGCIVHGESGSLAHVFRSPVGLHRSRTRYRATAKLRTGTYWVKRKSKSWRQDWIPAQTR